MTQIEICTSSPGPVAVVDRTVSLADIGGQITSALDLVWAFLRSSALVTGHNVVIYRGDIAKGAEAEIGVQVDQFFEPAAEVRCSQLPPVRVARAVHVGHYDSMGQTYQRLHEWCADHGYKVSDTAWEIYGDWNDDVSKIETEISLVLAS